MSLETMTANAPENFGLPSCLLTLPPNLYKERTGSSEASAGKPAATRVERHMQVSSEVSSLQSQLQQSIEEIRHSQEVHQSKVQIMMEQVLQSLSPTTSTKNSLWAQRKVDKEMKLIREEHPSLKAFMEPQKVPDVSRTSALPEISGPPIMLHDRGLKEDAPSFQSFIQTELQLLKASMISEVQASKVECLANVEGIRNILEHHGNHYENKEERRVPGVGDVALQESQTGRSVTLDSDSSSTVDCEVGVNDGLPQQTSVSDGLPRQIFSSRRQPANLRDSTDSGTRAAAEFKAGVSHVIDEHDRSTTISRAICTNRVLKAQSAESHKRFLYRFAVSQRFAMFCIVLVLVNGIWVGYEVDNPSSSEHGWMRVVSLVFNSWFIVELAIRIAGLRTDFILGPDWSWNLLDAFCVLISIPDFFALSVNVSVLRIIRLAKLSKTIRLVRVVKIFRSLKEILATVFFTLGSLFWSFVALLFAAYVFAILLLQALRLEANEPSRLEGEVGTQFGRNTAENFGSVSRSILTLFSFITSGQDWYEFALEMGAHGSYISESLLMLWVFFATFGLVNVVVGVFCARAVEAQESIHDLRLEKQSETREGKIFDLINMFQMIDTRNYGLITWEQFHDFANDEEGRAICEAHGLSLLALEPVWHVMVGNRDKDAFVDTSSFVMGFLRLSDDHFNSALLLLSHAVKGLRQELKEVFRKGATTS